MKTGCSLRGSITSSVFSFTSSSGWASGSCSGSGVFGPSIDFTDSIAFSEGSSVGCLDDYLSEALGAFSSMSSGSGATSSSTISGSCSTSG